MEKSELINFLEAEIVEQCQCAKDGYQTVFRDKEVPEDKIKTLTLVEVEDLLEDLDAFDEYDNAYYTAGYIAALRYTIRRLERNE